MKRTFFKYNYHKNICFLSIILLFCTYIIIRDCNYPVIYFSSNRIINKYIDILFISSKADDTFYNIAISYVAAYIFYLIQVYIPAVSSNSHGICILRNDIIKNVNNISILLLLISELTDNYQDVLYPNDTMELYIIETNQKQIFKITFLETYPELKDSISSMNSLILSGHAFNNLDDNLIELISSIPINDLFAISDNIYSQKINCKKTGIKPNESIDKAQFIITQLSQRYGFTFEKYNSTVNGQQKHEYDTYSCNAKKYTYKELEVKVQLTN